MTWPFLDARERALVAQALPLAGGREALEQQLARLGRIAELVRDASADVPEDELLERLAGCDHDADLRLPAPAALRQAFLLAKVAFLRDLSRAIAAAPAELTRLAETELAQSIHTHLVEELFVEVAAAREVAAGIRRGAVRKLVALWRDPLQVEIDDVAPMLDAIWEARCRLRPVLGTLLGTHETFSLFQRTRDDRFLDHFTRDDVSEDEREAFHEFLFGLSVEQCDLLHEEMHRRGVEVVSLADARRLLGLAEEPPELGSGPDAMVASYRVRKVRAAYRALSGTPGPRRTAEEHVVIARLARGETL
jgi:hypothetical protein